MDFTTLDAVPVTYEHLGVCLVVTVCLLESRYLFSEKHLDLLLQLPDVEYNASGCMVHIYENTSTVARHWF